MEYLYIKAASEDGPCKIGRASDVQKRLVQLQTGHPEKLHVFGSFKLRGNSKLAESLCHWILQEHKTPSMNEWFYVNVREATLVVQKITRLVAAVDKDDVILENVVWECQLADGDDWAKYRKANEDKEDEYEDEDREFPRLDMIYPADVKAMTLGAPKLRRFTFNDMMKSYRDGYPLIEQGVDELLPKLDSKSFKNMLPVIEYLHKYGAGNSINYATPWMSWLYGRDTTEAEVNKLVKIWNEFSTHWNRVLDDGVSEPESGVEDKVNGVEFYAVPPNAGRGQSGYLCFDNESFRITLKLPPKVSGLVDEGKDDALLWRTARKVSSDKIVGNILPNISRFFEQPFDEYFEKAKIVMNKDLAEWLSRSSYDFPKPRPETFDVSGFTHACLSREIVLA